MELISVVIPVRNGEKTVERAVESALRQTLRPLEVIVVDDGSTDGTSQLLRQFAGRIRVLDGPCQGAGPARNLGVKVARGKLIAFLDADDEWYEGKLAAQAPLLSPKVIVGSYADYVTYPNSFRVGTSIRTRDDETANQQLLEHGTLPCLLSSWVVPRDALLATPFDPEFIVAQDYEIAHRLMQQGFRFSIVRRPLIAYSLHGSSETATRYVEQFLSAEYVRENARGASLPPLDEYIRTAGHSLKSRALSGYQFRAGLVAVGDSRYLMAMFHFIAATFLAPKSVWTKFIRQSRFTYRGQAK